MKYLLLTMGLLTCLLHDASAQRSRHHHRSRRQHRRAFYHTHRADARTTPPSPYRGENTPINDGQRRNRQRNLNYNTGQPLPANNGR